MQAVLWVVEMETRPGVWVPTADVRLTKREAAALLADWHREEPDLGFRVRLAKYERTKGGK